MSGNSQRQAGRLPFLVPAGLGVPCAIPSTDWVTQLPPGRGYDILFTLCVVNGTETPPSLICPLQFPALVEDAGALRSPEGRWPWHFLPAVFMPPFCVLHSPTLSALLIFKKTKPKKKNPLILVSSLSSP